MANERAFHYPSRFVVSSLLLIGYVFSSVCWFVKYRGIGHIPPPTEGGFIVAANHQTYVDPVWISIPMRRRFRYMAYDKAFEWRFVGPFIRYLGAFPVSYDVGGTFQALKEALVSLRNGAVLTIFPEGGRAFDDGNMQPFKTGVVRIALQAGVPILPVTIRGGNRIWPQGQKYPHLFRRVEIIFHEPILIKKDAETDLHEQIENWTNVLRETIGKDLDQD